VLNAGSSLYPIYLFSSLAQRIAYLTTAGVSLFEVMSCVRSFIQPITFALPRYKKDSVSVRD